MLVSITMCIASSSFGLFSWNFWSIFVCSLIKKTGWDIHYELHLSVKWFLHIITGKGMQIVCDCPYLIVIERFIAFTANCRANKTVGFTWFTCSLDLKYVNVVKLVMRAFQNLAGTLKATSIDRGLTYVTMSKYI